MQLLILGEELEVIDFSLLLFSDFQARRFAESIDNAVWTNQVILNEATVNQNWDVDKQRGISLFCLIFDTSVPL